MAQPLDWETMRLAPGQSRPLGFRLSLLDTSDPAISFRIVYNEVDSLTSDKELSISHTVAQTELHEPHRFTFLHPGHIVSYAILRAPSQKALSAVNSLSEFPIFLCLHGAGLEADSTDVRGMLDAVPDLRAWVLFPTGATSWSADDWRESTRSMLILCSG